jgi:hypothetical protein
MHVANEIAPLLPAEPQIFPLVRPEGIVRLESGLPM